MDQSMQEFIDECFYEARKEYYWEDLMSCHSPSDYKEEDIDGICPQCGGQAYEACDYARTECELCGCAPCQFTC